MRSPKEMQNIQIDITNACTKTCSNCTRFCGHHSKPFFMEYQYFKSAVDSLNTFPGVVGMIGGEPTLHPEFEKMAQYLAASRLEMPEALCRKPIFDMGKEMHRELLQGGRKCCGLWSTIGKLYYKYFEVISDTFAYQILNDHSNPCKHQSLLMSWKDFGLSEEEWIEKRDNCWIQNSWSATITPKGAFFCEVAGALDMLFDGPGGWDINDHNWWKKTPDQFGSQLTWCDICGAALNSPSRISSDGRDDVSKTLFSMLEMYNSPKLKQGKCILHEGKIEGKAFSSGSEYMETFENIRIRQGQTVLYPHHIDQADPDLLLSTLAQNYSDWVFVPLKEGKKYPGFLKNYIFNPGCIYSYNDDWLFFNMRASSLRNVAHELPIRRLAEIFPSTKNVPISSRDIYTKDYVKYIIRGWFRSK